MDLALVWVNLLQLIQASIPDLLSVLLLSLVFLGRLWRIQLLTRALSLTLEILELLPLALREGRILIFWLFLRLLLLGTGILQIVFLHKPILLPPAMASSLAYPYHVVSLFAR